MVSSQFITIKGQLKKIEEDELIFMMGISAIASPPPPHIPHWLKALSRGRENMRQVSAALIGGRGECD